MGISEDIALDLMIGYTKIHYGPASRGDFGGLTDTFFGIRWRVLDEFIEENAKQAELDV